VTPGSGQSVTARVTFSSVQASEKGPDGDTCDNWDLDYTLIPSAGSWLIDKVLATTVVERTQPADPHVPTAAVRLHVSTPPTSAASRAGRVRSSSSRSSANVIH